MAAIWSDEGRFARWLDVELAALEGWAEVGAVPAEVVAEIRRHAVVPTPERIAELERVTDHDTAAFVDAVAEQLGDLGRHLHYGLTSSDVVDTALSLQLQQAGRLLLHGIDRALAAARAPAAEHKETGPTRRSPPLPPEAPQARGTARRLAARPRPVAIQGA